LPFSVGAVVLAQSFVAAPFFIRALAAAVHDIEPDVEEAAAIDGASTAAVLRKVTMPLVAGSFVSGAVMAWARSVGEFGATILFAGNLPGRTQTMPLWIYVGFETNLDQAVGLSVVLLVLALAVLIVVRMIERIGLDGPFQNT
jgi:molybdate transport system permease protein